MEENQLPTKSPDDKESDLKIRASQQKEREDEMLQSTQEHWRKKMQPKNPPPNNGSLPPRT
jgi:hypothetical protein